MSHRSRGTELESLSGKMFSPLSEKEASLVVGGAEPIAYTGSCYDTYIGGEYLGCDAVITDMIVPLAAAAE